MGRERELGKRRDRCTSKRVIDFTGNQRTDSNGGVPAYRNQSVVPEGPSTFRVVDEFSTGQISSRSRSHRAGHGRRRDEIPALQIGSTNQD
jgi:hypothetical protein